MGESPRWWSPLALAWSFLTVLPVPASDAGPRNLAASLAFFPLVGVGLGALLGTLGLLLDRLLPSGPVAVLLVGVAVFLTGGLHLDGLMDTADGVFGGRSRERRLEIMRDSRVGSFGVCAGALALIAQYSCLSTLGGLARLATLVAALALSRWAMVVAIRWFPAARSSGLGATFQGAASGWPFVVATAIAVGAALTAGLSGLVALALGSFVVILGGRFLVGRLGGLTGDTYGALAVVVETASLFVAAGFLHGA